jgi:hypothetical protein
MTRECAMADGRSREIVDVESRSLTPAVVENFMVGCGLHKMACCESCRLSTQFRLGGRGGVPLRLASDDPRQLNGYLEGAKVLNGTGNHRHSLKCYFGSFRFDSFLFSTSDDHSNSQMLMTKEGIPHN